MAIRMVSLVFAMLSAGGCAADALYNPSFPLTIAEAQTELREMRSSPRPAARPVVVISGYLDPGFASLSLKEDLQELLGPGTRIIAVAPGFVGTMESACADVLRRVEGDLPTGDPGWTTEVDVVGISMGGLVAQYAAMPRIDGGKRLRIARLFTICTPHRGARAANMPTFEERVVDMRQGSLFLGAIGQAPRSYEIVPYCRLDDSIVGEENTAPEGMNPWWVPTPAAQMGHMQCFHDHRIIADIARRLRGEAPFTLSPAAPLPDTQAASPSQTNESGESAQGAGKNVSCSMPKAAPFITAHHSPLTSGV